uniref:Uncharacterized protein n=1 Tax=Anguilla anguilla TaxID=7936 RepID=A0A0E9V8Z8_ANGAN
MLICLIIDSSSENTLLYKIISTCLQERERTPKRSKEINPSDVRLKKWNRPQNQKCGVPFLHLSITLLLNPVRVVTCQSIFKSHR